MRTTETRPTVRIGLVQANAVVGDIPANVAAAKAAYLRLKDQGADLVMLPESFIAGYDPQDLVRRRAFVAACMAAAEELAAFADEDVPLGIGLPILADEAGEFGELATNSYVFVGGGRMMFRTDKLELPKDSVFNEERRYLKGKPKVFRFKGLTIGLPICEDIWHERVTDLLLQAGVDVLLVPNGSPSYLNKPAKRHSIVASRVSQAGVPLLYLNLVGGQEELGFDGASFAMNPDEPVRVFMPAWQEAEAVMTLVQDEFGVWRFDYRDLPDYPAQPEPWQYLLDGIITITRDYLRKSWGGNTVVFGDSGGVDSALVKYIAARVVGAENALAVRLPYKYTTAESMDLAEKAAANLGMPQITLPIGPTVEALRAGYEGACGGPLTGTADENLQSRARGVLLMAIANQQRRMLLSTGNRSEMATGYATLYGDMNGGFNPLKGVPKMWVFGLCEFINRLEGWEVIPSRIITRPPSAELKDGQKDEDSLPPYPVLDKVLECYIDRNMDAAETAAEVERFMIAESIVTAKTAAQWTQETLDRVWGYQFKRVQAPPGAKVTQVGFGEDWQYPVANRWRELVEPLKLAA